MRIPEGCSLEGKRKAIIVGINRYKDAKIQPLKGAENDARDIYQRLTDPNIGNFEVSEDHYLTGESATSERIRGAISEIFWGGGTFDIALFYYSGYAFTDEHGIGYIAPYDMLTDEPYANGINMEELKTYISVSKGIFHVVLILDCCYSGISKAVK